MKRIAIFFICLLLVGCSKKPINTAGLVVPENEKLPIEGKWEVVDYLGEGYSNRVLEDYRLNIGDTVLFHRDGAIIGNRYVLGPKFRLRNIPSKDYLFKTYRTELLSGFSYKENIVVINIIKNEDNFAELLLLEENMIVLAVEK
ncbi:MAG: hypothetical protein GXZ11_05470 [Tissierellia bacterium]|nr:hypothetical protein [Tissierellia bacterium]